MRRRKWVDALIDALIVTVTLCLVLFFLSLIFL